MNKQHKPLSRLNIEQSNNLRGLFVPKELHSLGTTAFPTGIVALYILPLNYIKLKKIIKFKIYLI